MPIRPENRDRYPPDWPQIRARILQRARNCCELCGVANHVWGYRDAQGVFHRVPKGPLRDAFPKDERVRPPFTVATMHGPLKIIEIVLTIAHLDHIPEHCSDDNLKAMCQACHLGYGAQHHAQTRYRTRRDGLVIADMFYVGVDACA